MACARGLMFSSLLLLLTGCGRTETPGTGTEASATGWREALAEQMAVDGWRTEESSSGMDGRISTAIREFAFPDRNTQFIVEISCRSSTRTLAMTMQSFVGDPETPAEQSAFVAEIFQGLLGNIRHVPVARVRIGDGKVVDSTLMTYFEIGRYNNEIRFTDAQSLGSSFPMLLEVSNGMGTFEIPIDLPARARQIIGDCTRQDVAKHSAASERQNAAVDERTGAAEVAGPVASPAGNDASAGFVGKASFDCRKAASFAEKSVCASAVLGRLDEVLAENYRVMTSADIGDGARTSLRRTQRAWLAGRDGCGDDNCLEASYRGRIDEICETPVLSGVYPACTSSDEIE